MKADGLKELVVVCTFVILFSIVAAVSNLPRSFVFGGAYTEVIFFLIAIVVIVATLSIIAALIWLCIGKKS